MKEYSNELLKINFACTSGTIPGGIPARIPDGTLKGKTPRVAASVNVNVGILLKKKISKKC